MQIRMAGRHDVARFINLKTPSDGRARAGAMRTITRGSCEHRHAVVAAIGVAPQRRRPGGAGANSATSLIAGAGWPRWSLRLVAGCTRLTKRSRSTGGIIGFAWGGAFGRGRMSFRSYRPSPGRRCRGASCVGLVRLSKVPKHGVSGPAYVRAIRVGERSLLYQADQQIGTGQLVAIVRMSLGSLTRTLLGQLEHFTSTGIMIAEHWPTELLST
jgi:hypothetical protein